MHVITALLVALILVGVHVPAGAQEPYRLGAIFSITGPGSSLGIPERGFDRDHYDVPEEWYDDAVAAGAVPVSSRELIIRLLAAGLRRRKRSTVADGSRVEHGVGGEEQ